MLARYQHTFTFDSVAFLVMHPNVEVNMTGYLSKVGVTVFVASSPGDGGSIPLRASKGNIPLVLVTLHVS